MLVTADNSPEWRRPIHRHVPSTSARPSPQGRREYVAPRSCRVGCGLPRCATNVQSPVSPRRLPCCGLAELFDSRQLALNESAGKRVEDDDEDEHEHDALHCLLLPASCRLWLRPEAAMCLCGSSPHLLGVLCLLRFLCVRSCSALRVACGLPHWATSLRYSVVPIPLPRISVLLVQPVEGQADYLVLPGH